jgi:hypothetical protein
MHRRLAPLAALALASTLVLGACSTDDATKDSSSDTTAKDVRVEVTYKDGLFDPNGARIKGTVGEPITVVIDADAPNSLHVHSTPEQEIAFEAGTSEHEIVIDRPGVVEVEAHDPASIVLQLEVR